MRLDTFRGKLLSLTVFYGLWLVAYTVVAAVTAGRELSSVATDVDVYTPFTAYAIMPYLLAYIQPFALVYLREKEFTRFLTASTIMAITTFTIYLVVPTTGPPCYGPLPDDIFGELVSLQYGLDHRINCFPSGHCSTAVLVALATPSRWGVFKLGMIALSILILLSTITLRQHWLLCIPGGVVMGSCSWWLSGKLVKV